MGACLGFVVTVNGRRGWTGVPKAGEDEGTSAGIEARPAKIVPATSLCLRRLVGLRLRLAMFCWTRDWVCYISVLGMFKRVLFLASSLENIGCEALDGSWRSPLSESINKNASRQDAFTVEVAICRGLPCNGRGLYSARPEEATYITGNR